MISEISFVNQYSSLWRSLAPTGDLFVRHVNLHLYIREFPPLKSETAAGRRAFINEIAFNVFCKAMAHTISVGPTPNDIVEAVNSARNDVSRIERIVPQELFQPVPHEIEDFTEQARRLEAFFRKKAWPLKPTLKPQFPGCGIIDASQGDVHFGETLYEVKAGDRAYRSVDFRQLLVYSALASRDRLYPISRVGLVNPRVGTSCVFKLDDLAFEIAGRSGSELLHEIVHAISAGDISR